MDTTETKINSYGLDQKEQADQYTNQYSSALPYKTVPAQAPPAPILPQPVYLLSANQVTPAQTQMQTGNTPMSKNVQSTAKCWYVTGILSAIFCFWPFGIVGAVHAYQARQAAKSGNFAVYKKKNCRARCFTAAAISIGVQFLVGLSTWLPRLLQTYDVPYSGGGGGYSALAPVPAWTDEGFYLGCYEDRLLHRDLSGLNKDFGLNNNVSVCVAFCADSGYKYAGLQDGTQCHCGNTYGSYNKANYDELCSASCPADGNYTCGEVEKNSIYRTNYIGCFKDDLKRSLGESSYMMSSTNATPKTCVHHCGKEGYEFAGLQNSDECYCGNDLNRYGESSSTICNMSCAGDANSVCGGILTNSIHKTEFQSNESYTYLGCYKDSTADRDLDAYYMKLGSEDGVYRCVEKCANLGYKYAGLQFGDECFCSYEYGKYPKTSDSECDIDCPDKSDKCGGLERNSVYRTHYLGCFADDSTRALNESIIIAASDLTPTACINECEYRGYLFAGVQYGSQCFCGHDLNRYYETPGYECYSKCPGDYESVCGGGWRNSVFRTNS